MALVASLILYGQLRKERRRAAVSTPGGPATTAPADERAIVATLIGQTEQVRELRFDHPVTPAFLSSEELAAEIRKMAGQQDIAQGLPKEQTLEALGMVPPGTDLRKTLEDAAASGVIGFYDPETERLVVESGSQALDPLGKITLVHELTHAVTDQHFHLNNVLTGKEPGDVGLARTALIEGDATLSMQLWSFQYLSFEEQLAVASQAAQDLLSGAGPDTPPALTALIAFPYVEGEAFVQSLQDQGGWQAVDDAYLHPPDTTEQILHPEKFLSREPADDVRARFAVPGAHVIDRGPVGEEFLRAMLQPDTGGIPIPGLSIPSPSTDGWNGAGYVTLQGPTGTIVHVDIHWDGAGDPAEFQPALVEWAGSAFGAPATEAGTANGGPQYALGNGGCLQIDSPTAQETTFTVLPTACR